MNPKLALLVLGLGLVFVASPVTAGPLVLDFEAIGAGTAGGPGVSNCQVGPLAPGCVSNSGSDPIGEVIGKHIGKSEYTMSLMAGSPASLNSSVPPGSCLPANGTGTITAANGDVINFKTVGWLCEQSVPGSNYHYNGTYFIDPGTGRFTDAFGAGNLAAGFVKGIGAPTFLKFDGTITY